MAVWVGGLALTLIALAGSSAAQVESTPPLGRGVAAPLPLPALAPSPARLAQARALLAARPQHVPEQILGGYLLLTDLAEPALVARAAAVVSSLEEVYFERYGRRPVGASREAIVLFEAEESYRQFQIGDTRLAGVTISTGFASGGIVATFRGTRSDDELLGTLVHELAHLLNRRALGPSLPSWLDEGLADDLGASSIDSRGALLPGSWSRTLDRQAQELRISGGEAALRDLASLYGPDGGGAGRLDLGAMLALDWEEFVAAESAELHYAVAAAFVRMLLAAPASRAIFRDWLTAVSLGASPAAEELRRKLDRPWAELDRSLALWTRFELARLPPLPPAKPDAD